MTVDNDVFTTKFRILRFVTTLIFLPLIFAPILTFRPEHILLWGLNKYNVTSIFVAILLGIVIYYHILDYYYVYFSDTGNKLVFRFYSMSFLGTQKYSIEIMKEKFTHYKIEKKFFGKKIILILFQKKDNGYVKYPPVNLNAMKKEMRNKILSSLDNCLKK